MKLKALIWDVDGTLVDSEELHRSAFNQAFSEFDLDWHWNQHLYLKLLDVTGGKERIRHYATISGLDYARLPVSIDELHKRKTQIYQQDIQNGALPLRSGVKRILKETQKHGLRLAIATTTSVSNIATLFDTKLLDAGQWEVIVAGCQVKNKKPAPDVYFKVLNALNLNPMECLAVEDSHNGLQAALAAGIPTVIVINTYTKDQNFNGAVTVLNNFEAWHKVASAFSNSIA